MEGLIYLIALLLLVFLQKSLAQMSYIQWLQQLDDQILKIPSDTEKQSLKIPLDLEIITDSPYEQCVSANSPYCFAPVTSSSHSACSGGGATQTCIDAYCAKTTDELDLKEYLKSFQFTTPVAFGSQPINSMPECGLVLATNALYFEEPTNAADQLPCDTSFIPSIIVNVTNSDQKATISFKVHSAVERFQFLKMTAFDALGTALFGTVISVDGQAVTSADISYIVDPTIETYSELKMDVFTVVVFERGYAIFSEGEIVMTVEHPKEGLGQISVEFGSEEFKGSIVDITMYDVTATTNEIYSMYSGEPLATNVVRPDCTCPRDYTDSFGLLRSQSGYSSEQSCYPAFQHSSSSFQIRYQGGKWNMFSIIGWVSDFTTKAEILLKMPQPMLTYMVSGVISAQYDDKIPKSMQVRILGSSPDKGAVVYVSDNCEEEYGIPRTKLPQFLSDEISPIQLSTGSGRKRRSLDEVPPKCYSMEDVIKYYYQSARQTATETRFEIPILHPDESSSLLSDEYIGDVSIKLIGHEHDAPGNDTDWYYVQDLYIATRPHCGGYNYTKVGAPTTMSEYYNFRKPNARAYSCHCPQGFTGDMCESSVEVPGIYRYMKEPGVYADCDCSDLIHEDLPQCEKISGQCNCVGSPDLDLTGRQCHWYISDITPLYGPIAGGTTVVIEGGYLSGYNISFSVLLDTNQIYSNIPNNSDKHIHFSTPSYHTANTSVDLVVEANTALDIGPHTKFFKFEYRPNPVLEDIQPNTTILSGGKILTVSGKFFDSVYAPQMIIYLRQTEIVVETFVTTCEVIDGTTMYCPTANMSMEVTSLLDEESQTSLSDTPPGLDNSTAHKATVTTSTITADRRRRYVSDIEENPINGNNDVEFTLGFIYDGLEDYMDLEESSDPEIRDLSPLYVYKDPAILKFQDDFGDTVLEHNPAQSHTIRIKGERMDHGVNADDYEIEIGVEYCEVIDLTSNQITCRPPEKQPQADGYNYIKHKNKEIPGMKVKVGNIRIFVGHVYYITSLWTYNTAFRTSMIVLIVVVCLLIMVVAFLLVRRSKRKIRLNITAHYMRGSGGEVGAQPLDANIQAIVDRCKIPHNRLNLGKKLGQGKYGLVYKGQLITPAGNLRTVAVKTLKGKGDTSLEEVENFLTEGTLMINLKHENILLLVGVVSEEGEMPLVVLPYMENRDLHTFIRRDDLDLEVADILHFGYQIANGMSYLAKERFVHRDLATRDCMVDWSCIVKIAGFGMSKDVYETDYYKMEDSDKPLPVKWMAVESLKEGRYTTKSDVWSYGVTIWELFTRGCTPYPAVPNSGVKDFIISGNRLDKPPACPSIIYDMMCKCWEEYPDNRPTFDEISDFFEKLLIGEKTTPTTGSDVTTGYYHSRNATKHIPEDYLHVDGGNEDGTYITPLLTPDYTSDLPTALVDHE